MKRQCLRLLFTIILIFLGISAKTFSQPSFRIPLYGADAQGHRDSVFIGVDPLATFCLDTALGEIGNVPALPVGFYIALYVPPPCNQYRIRMPLGPGLDLRKYYSMIQSDTYYVKCQSDVDTGYVLSWSPTMGGHYQVARLQVWDISSYVDATNMLTANSYLIPFPTIGSHPLRIIVQIMQPPAVPAPLMNPIGFGLALIGLIACAILLRWRGGVRRT